jgi:hypothetical protein
MHMLSVEVKYKGELFEIELDGLTCNTLEDVLQEVADQYNMEHREDENFEPIKKIKPEEAKVSFEDIPEFLHNWEEIEKNLYIIEESGLDIDVFEAGHDLGIDLKNVEDRYIGSYSDDEEFAEEYTTEIGEMGDIPSWVVIDWSETARNLMYDISASYGHYFRDY